MATMGFIARSERVTDRFVSRTIRLAYLTPGVLERLVVGRRPPALSWNDLVGATYLPWTAQLERVFGRELIVKRLR